MVSYVPKKNKGVVLLYSMRDKKEVDEVSGNPVIILDYNNNNKYTGAAEGDAEERPAENPAERKIFSS
ncbi:hypothetical protein cypCar_00035723 [Cyprinus carpio]|nr:hypothetical protein cypCar_00035723 [Cyprinus carpio]